MQRVYNFYWDLPAFKIVPVIEHINWENFDLDFQFLAGNEQCIPNISSIQLDYHQIYQATTSDVQEIFYSFRN